MGLYKPTITRKRPDGTRTKTKGGLWWGSFRHPATDTLERVALKTANKKAAATLLANAEHAATLGLIHPTEYDSARRATTIPRVARAAD